MRFTSQTSSDGVREQLFSLGSLNPRGSRGSRDEIPGVLWTPDGAAGTRPLILMGHGGGQHKKAPGIVSRARRFVTEGGFAVVAADVSSHGDRPQDEEYGRIADGMQARVDAGEDQYALIAGLQALVARQTVPEWQAVLTAVQELGHVGAGPVGYWGVSMGCGLGVPFVAAEPRVRAAVLGLGGAAVPALAEAAAQITVPLEFLVQWDDAKAPEPGPIRRLRLPRKDPARQPRQTQRPPPPIRAGQHPPLLHPPPNLNTQTQASSRPN
jgi:dienelactone hydrolase